jgi:hypothetical protein
VSFKVVLTDRCRRDIVSWKLPDPVLVDVHLRLRQDLSDFPGIELVRSDEGMVYPLEIIDPHNRLSLYRFFFQVIYGQDEATLYVIRGSMLHTFGI